VVEMVRRVVGERVRMDAGVGVLGAGGFGGLPSQTVNKWNLFSTETAALPSLPASLLGPLQVYVGTAQNPRFPKGFEILLLPNNVIRRFYCSERSKDSTLLVLHCRDVQVTQLFFSPHPPSSHNKC
jgi:hypothetical protein